MNSIISSDFVPFAWEPMQRADRAAGGAQSRQAGSERDAAMRRLRSPANPRDAVLSSLAVKWCHGLPADLQPLALCAHYPRVANRIALCWNDKQLTRRLLKGLLRDQRGGRQGFPKAVEPELLALARAVERHIAA